MKTYVIFDDTNEKSEIIADVIGNRGFADVVVKKRRLESYYRDLIKDVFPDADWRLLSSAFEYHDLVAEFSSGGAEDAAVLHCFSNFFISDPEKAALSFKKLNYIDKPYRVNAGKKTAALMFPHLSDHIAYCEAICGGKTSIEAAKAVNDKFEIEGLTDIGLVENFIQCITGTFDSRYFNSLKGSEYTLVKSSTNKKKIKSEYTYYHLLPENMKYWFVLPFDYKENGDTASYTMERLHMTDIAIKWVHGSIDENEFGELMDKYFYFFKSRKSRECSEKDYTKTSEALYTDKVKDRIDQLKKLKEYKKIEELMSAGADMSLDEVAEKYFALKQKAEKRLKNKNRSVIGHGDPCFANAMYNRTTKTLKFIDPKGALTEEELWTDPYYDIAKLSHSVCGRYDFFNNAMFDVHLGEDLLFELDIFFDNRKYIDIFRKKLEENGYDYALVRVYEASLFLSMLPLHIDNPFKVFGFILNAKNILTEIEKYV